MNTSTLVQKVWNFCHTLRDDGVGFDPACVPPGGMGLLSMAERCAVLGVGFEVAAAPGTGTTIRVSIKKEAERIPTGPGEGHHAHG